MKIVIEISRVVVGKASSFYFVRYEQNEMCLTVRLAFQSLCTTRYIIIKIHFYPVHFPDIDTFKYSFMFFVITAFLIIFLNKPLSLFRLAVTFRKVFLFLHKLEPVYLKG